MAHAPEGGRRASPAAATSRSSPRRRSSASTRPSRGRTSNGRPPGGWHPEEGLGRAEALRLFTSDDAYAEFAEKRRGRIAPGFDADFTVLDREIFAPGTPAAEILKAKVVMTVVGGEIVYKGN